MSLLLDFGKFSELTKAEALFKAVDYYLMRTSEKHIPWARMSEIVRGNPFHAPVAGQDTAALIPALAAIAAGERELADHSG